MPHYRRLKELRPFARIEQLGCIQRRRIRAEFLKVLFDILFGFVAGRKLIARRVVVEVGLPDSYPLALEILLKHLRGTRRVLRRRIREETRLVGGAWPTLSPKIDRPARWVCQARADRQDDVLEHCGRPLNRDAGPAI